MNADQLTSSIADAIYRYSSHKATEQRKSNHIRLHGLSICIETPKGHRRRPDWPEMPADYGYIKRTEGADGDAVDVFIGPHQKSEMVYVIDQCSKDGAFDEHKVMLGYTNYNKAVDAYKAAYTKGWKVGKVTAMTIEQFKNWLKDGNKNAQIQHQVSRYAFDMFDDSGKPRLRPTLGGTGSYAPVPQTWAMNTGSPHVMSHQSQMPQDGVKQPWHMSINEFAEHHANNPGMINGGLSPDDGFQAHEFMKKNFGPETYRVFKFTDRARKQHLYNIAHAMRTGQPVHPDAIADYPRDIIPHPQSSSGNNALADRMFQGLPHQFKSNNPHHADRNWRPPQNRQNESGEATPYSVLSAADQDLKKKGLGSDIDRYAEFQQLGLFDDIPSGNHFEEKKHPRWKAGDQAHHGGQFAPKSKAHQPNLFETHGHPDQKWLFGDEGAHGDMVLTPSEPESTPPPAQIQQPQSQGIIQPPALIPSDQAKPGQQLGLFGDAPMPKANPPKIDIGSQPKAKQGNLFDTHGNANQMDFFGDGVMSDDLVYKPNNPAMGIPKRTSGLGGFMRGESQPLPKPQVETPQAASFADDPKEPVEAERPAINPMARPEDPEHADHHLSLAESPKIDGKDDRFTREINDPRTRKYLLGVAMKMTNDPHEAEDAVQDAMTRAFMNKHKYNPEEPFMGWMQKILRNTQINKHRDKAALKRGGGVIMESMDAPAGSIEYLTSHDFIGSNARIGKPDVSQDEREAFGNALPQLPEKHRRVIELALQGNSKREIAKEMNFSEQRAGKLHEEALVMLKKLIAKTNYVLDALIERYCQERDADYYAMCLRVYRYSVFGEIDRYEFTEEDHPRVESGKSEGGEFSTKMHNGTPIPERPASISENHSLHLSSVAKNPGTLGIASKLANVAKGLRAIGNDAQAKHEASQSSEPASGSPYDHVDWGKVQGHLDEVNQLHKQSLADGHNVANIANYNGVIPKWLIPRLASGRKFVDPSMLGAKWTKDTPQPMQAPKDPEHGFQTGWNSKWQPGNEHRGYNSADEAKQAALGHSQKKPGMQFAIAQHPEGLWYVAHRELPKLPAQPEQMPQAPLQAPSQVQSQPPQQPSQPQPPSPISTPQQAGPHDLDEFGNDATPEIRAQYDRLNEAVKGIAYSPKEGYRSEEDKRRWHDLTNQLDSIYGKLSNARKQKELERQQSQVRALSQPQSQPSLSVQPEPPAQDAQGQPPKSQSDLNPLLNPGAPKELDSSEGFESEDARWAEEDKRERAALEEKWRNMNDPDHPEYNPYGDDPRWWVNKNNGVSNPQEPPSGLSMRRFKNVKDAIRERVAKTVDDEKQNGLTDDDIAKIAHLAWGMYGVAQQEHSRAKELDKSLAPSDIADRQRAARKAATDAFLEDRKRIEQDQSLTQEQKESAIQAAEERRQSLESQLMKKAERAARGARNLKRGRMRKTAQGSFDPDSAQRQRREGFENFDSKVESLLNEYPEFLSGNKVVQPDQKLFEVIAGSVGKLPSLKNHEEVLDQAIDEYLQSLESKAQGQDLDHVPFSAYFNAQIQRYSARLSLQHSLEKSLQKFCNKAS